MDVTRRRSLLVTTGGEGTYSLIESTPTGVASDPSLLQVTLPTGIITASVQVIQPAASVAVSAQSATYTVGEGLAAGHTYLRSWSDGGGWHAYLGRDGVLLNVTATSADSAISQIELQGKAPSGDWYDLIPIQNTDPSLPNGAGITVSQNFPVRLGAVRPDKPLIPADLSLAGAWQLRARARTTAGRWSTWSPVSSLAVEVPITTVTKTGQTLPPIADAEWYTASEVRTYNYRVWIP
jgi:hypothetical protein